MPPPAGSSSGGLPSRVEHLSPQVVLLPRVYGTSASPLWVEVLGPCAWQATTSWAVCRPACLTVVSMAPGDVSHGPRCRLARLNQRHWSTAPATGTACSLGRPSASDPLGVLWCFSAALCVYAFAVSGAPSRSFTSVRVRCVLCAVSVASWRLFNRVRVVCGTRVELVASLTPPPFFSWSLV